MQENDSSTTTEASAQTTLSQTFRCETRNTSVEDVDRAVELLRAFPPLAQKTYLTRRHPAARVPLFILAERGATLEQIKSIRELYETNNEIKLDNAAKSGLSRMHIKPELMKVMEGGKAPMEVLEFLVKEYPSLLEQRDSLGRCPVHKFLQRWSYGFYAGQTEECDQLALHMIQQFSASCDLDLFQLALHAGCSGEIVEFLVQRLNQRSLPAFNFQGSFNGTVSLRDAKAISRILPNLQDFSFHLTPATPSAEAFCHLMNSIAEANSLQKFAITINGGYLRQHGEPTAEALQRALATPSLEDVFLHVTAAERLHDHELGVFVAGLMGRTAPLNSVKLIVSEIPSTQPLLTLLASPTCPKSVRIQGGSWEHHVEDADNPAVQETPSESSLESLVIVGCTLKVKAMEAVLREATRAPALQQFKLLDTGDSFSSKMVEDIVESLPFCQNLKEIELINKEGIQYSSICRLINHNNMTDLRKIGFSAPRGKRADSCQCLVETLEDNTTLEYLHCAGGIREPQDEKARLKIGYYLHLNRNGRKRTRDLELTRSEFVHMLSSVTTSSDDIRDNDQASSHCEQHPGGGSILFGLLREDPALWASTDSYLKRRASALLLEPAQRRRSSKKIRLS